MTEVTDTELEAWLSEAAALARRAGAMLVERFSDVHEEQAKGHAHNLVTEADHAAEALIVDGLRAHFPAHGVRAEEGRGSEAGPLTWLVDPLDGTNNYAHGFPVWSVSLALIAQDTSGGGHPKRGHPKAVPSRGAPADRRSADAGGATTLLGVTYDPLRDELFAARRGGGATLGAQPLAVSARETLAQALVATGFPYDKASNPDNNLAQLAGVLPRVRGVRRAGSAALDLAYVAAGRLDGYWERGVRAWDVAAGLLMVREAGGRVSDQAGGPPALDGGSFLATNGLIHDELMERLQCVTLPPLS